MKKILLISIALIQIVGCSKKDETPPEVTFKLSISGFSLSTEKFGDLKSQNAFESFTHKYPTGMVLTFSTTNGLIYTFNTGGTPLNEFGFTLPVGEYSISGTTGGMTWSGDSWMALAINSQSVTITESTTQLDISVTPLCALILISDEYSLVDKAYIDSETYPLFTQGVLRYKYFYPSKSVYIIKKDGAQLEMETDSWQFGYVYKIEVTNSGTSRSLNINPNFIDADTIIW